MQELLLIIHILAVGAWVGANVVQLASTRRMLNIGGEVGAEWMRNIETWARNIYMPVGIVLLATGIAMVINNDAWEFSHAFVSIGFLVVIVAAALGMVVFAKGARRAAAAFDAGDDSTGRAEANKLMPWGMLDTILLVIAIAAMVGKWGA